ncbi:transketolase [Anaplasma phagocytophilum str. Norway variant2]|uniref:Transketolase n=1 Tax=Anaplasma phagocytophilum str. Norway variant2 TaxID=1392507 RepID=A0A161I5J7_ANAPH|nr:transketolase [Anaplasma phagocytophilum]ANC34073.1 transketolase [Anaplasma phagocytophilum str. Norway variant2]
MGDENQGAVQYSTQLTEMASAIRLLSIDAIQNAASGHPGMPLGMADVAAVLFSKFLRFSVQNPNWINRDRLVMSNGHGSMLIYSILHLLGYISIDDIKKFRQLHSITPGHPEYGCTPGIEATTGPLGQGLGCAVGMAIAERMLAQRFGGDLIDHYTYVMAGDGCLMEGISHEAASLAGHLGLGKLIVLFDDNGISIDGKISLASSDNVAARFASYGWDVWEVDGHDFGHVYAAIASARETNRPSIIACKTIIGKFMRSKENTSAAHSWPFTPADAQEVRESLGRGESKAFEVSADASALWKEVRERAELEYASWLSKSEQCDKIGELDAAITKGVPESVFEGLDEHFRDLGFAEATRKSFGRALEFFSQRVNNLVGGSADLTSSNNTKASWMKPITKEDFSGSYIHYGIREHAMAACMNGMALHAGVIPYGGTFLVFSDYCRPAIRLSALMALQAIYVMTHDSIGVGEDGPTHQPVEHLASLRAIPNLYVFRPADAVEVLECWEIALKLTKSPSLFVLSRQNVEPMRSELGRENRSGRGAYILREFEGDLRVTIFATGTEVGVAMAACDILHKTYGVGTRVISMPCWRLFDQQEKKYISGLLDNNSLKVAVEAGSSVGWHKYIGRDGIFIGLDEFGASGKCEDLYAHFGITKENLVSKVLARLHPAV